MIWPDDYIGQVLCGDSLDVMRGMPSDCIDTIITDPPYALEFMGKGWDKVLPSIEIWQEALRVAKPGTILMAFGGTRTYHRLTCMIEDAGWQIRDCMMWLYGSGFPKSMDISKAIDKQAGAEREKVQPGNQPAYQRGIGNVRPFMLNPNHKIDGPIPIVPEAQLWDGWGTALKPAWEPIVIAMKPIEGTFAQNALKHGVAGLNIDGGRIPGGDPSNLKRLEKQYSDNDSPTFKGLRPVVGGSLKGRWPANVILDEEAGALLDEQSRVSVSHRGKPRKSQQSGSGYGMTHTGAEYSDKGGASRFFYCAKADKRERNYGLRDGSKNNHPTVKPLSLMKYMCKLTATPTGGIVLDPFAGSGSTLIGAKTIGRPYIGIEISPEYCKIAEDRLRQEELSLTTPTNKEGT